MNIKLFLFLSLLLSNVVFANEIVHTPTEPLTKFLTTISGVPDFQKLLLNKSNIPMVKFTFDLKSKQFYFQNTTLYDYHFPFISENIVDYQSIDYATFENLVFSKDKSLMLGSLFYNQEKEMLGYFIYFKENFDSNDVITIHKDLESKILKFNHPLTFLFENNNDYLKNKKVLEKNNIPSLRWNQFHPIEETKPQVYNSSKSYGYLKKISLDEFKRGDYTAKDILIFDVVPLDIGPLSGVISLTPEVPYSHVILRSINQNIPNIFIPNALSDSRIKTRLGKLIEFEVLPTGEFNIQDEQVLGPKLKEMADDYFLNRVKKLPPLESDLSIKDFHFLNSNGASPSLVKAYGAKGTNMAMMNNNLRNNGVNRTSFDKGFLIPFSNFEDHIRKNIVTKKLCQKVNKEVLKNFKDFNNKDENDSIAIKEIINSLLSSCLSKEESKGNLEDLIKVLISQNDLVQLSLHRKITLNFIQEIIINAPLDETFYHAVLKYIKEANYDPHERIRFRSSTNAEDLPGINGAGLYTSKSGCLANSLSLKDGGDDLPPITTLEKERILKRIEALKSADAKKYESMIDDFEKDLIKTKPIDSAIKKVYASLWEERAFLFRDYYKIDHLKVYMGILVHPSFSDEAANGVIIIKEENDNSFTITITSQVEDISITNPELPNVTPEQLLLKVSSKGEINTTKTILKSNLSNDLLTADEKRRLVHQVIMTHNMMRKVYGHGKGTEYDLEFKLGSQREILLKQVRPLNEVKESGDDINNDKGIYTFHQHNHGWNGFDLKWGDEQNRTEFIIDTPQHDQGEDKRNTGFGWRPILKFNLIEYKAKDSNVKKTVWSLAKQPLDNLDYFCKKLDNTLGKNQKLEDYLNHFATKGSIKNPSSFKPCEENSVFNNIVLPEAKFYPDLICMVQIHDEEELKSPKIISLYVPYEPQANNSKGGGFGGGGMGMKKKETPQKTIYACVDGKTIPFNLKNN